MSATAEVVHDALNMAEARRCKLATVEVGYRLLCVLRSLCSRRTNDFCQSIPSTRGTVDH